jgi:hypothetical protein
MSPITQKAPFVDNTKLGDFAAQQPLSGVGLIANSAVMSQHGSFIRVTRPETGKA